MSESRGVLVASADRLFAEAAVQLIDSHEAWHSVGTAPDGITAVTAVARLHPEAVLVSGELPRLPVAGLIGQVRKRWPHVTVVVLGEPRPGGCVVLERTSDTALVMEALAAPPDDALTRNAETPSGVALLRSLTRRERTVLARLAAGAGPADIARSLGVSENTVRTHMQNLYGKLGRHSRLDVVRFALEQGLVSPEPAASD